MLTRKMEGDSAQSFYDGDKLVLTIEETDTAEGNILMALTGDLRSDTAHFLQDELNEFTTACISVTIDFKNVSFVAPSVLNALLNAQQYSDKIRRGRMVLRNIPDAVYQEMDETGITELLMIE